MKNTTFLKTSLIIAVLTVSCKDSDNLFKSHKTIEKTRIGEKAMLRNLFRINRTVNTINKNVRNYTYSAKERAKFYAEFLDKDTKQRIAKNRIKYLRECNFPPLKGIANINNWEYIKSCNLEKSNGYTQVKPLLEKINTIYQEILEKYPLTETCTPEEYIINKYKIHHKLASKLYFWSYHNPKFTNINYHSPEIKQMEEVLKNEAQLFLFNYKTKFREIFLSNDIYMVEFFELIHRKDFDTICFDAMQDDFSLEYQNRYYYSELEGKLDEIMQKIRFDKIPND